jgi:hypothetical protein
VSEQGEKFASSFRVVAELCQHAAAKKFAFNQFRPKLTEKIFIIVKENFRSMLSRGFFGAYDNTQRFCQQIHFLYLDKICPIMDKICPIMDKICPII